MKSLIVFGLLIACVVAEESRFAGIDINEYLQNSRAYTAMYKCLMDVGPCSPEGKEIKRRLPEAIATTCGTCTDSEKKMAREIINNVKEKHPEDWETLVKKYDPEGKFIPSLDKFLKE